MDEFLQTHYNGSFSRMVCEYICITGMTEAEVDALLEEKIFVNALKIIPTTIAGKNKFITFALSKPSFRK